MPKPPGPLLTHVALLGGTAPERELPATPTKLARPVTQETEMHDGYDGGDEFPDSHGDPTEGMSPTVAAFLRSKPWRDMEAQVARIMAAVEAHRGTDRYADADTYHDRYGEMPPAPGGNDDSDYGDDDLPPPPPNPARMSRRAVSEYAASVAGYADQDVDHGAVVRAVDAILDHGMSGSQALRYARGERGDDVLRRSARSPVDGLAGEQLCRYADARASGKMTEAECLRYARTGRVEVQSDDLTTDREFTAFADAKMRGATDRQAIRYARGEQAKHPGEKDDATDEMTARMTDPTQSRQVIADRNAADTHGVELADAIALISKIEDGGATASEKLKWGRVPRAMQDEAMVAIGLYE